MDTKRLLLLFSKETISQPIVYELVKGYNLVVNIFRAKVTSKEEGYMVIDLKGEEADIARAVSYLNESGVTVNEQYKGVQWDNEKCSGCGNCVAHCPTKALHIVNPATHEVDFDGGLCIGCLNCIENCPFKACSSIF